MTVRPRPRPSSATCLPSVAARLSAGMARRGSRLAAPSSAGTGRPSGSRSRSGASMAFSLRHPPRLCTVASLARPMPSVKQWQGGSVADITVRDAADGDTEAIARVAIAAGQDEEWSGSDPAYVGYLRARGRMVLAEHRGEVAGFGATVSIGTGPAAIT